MSAAMVAGWTLWVSRACSIRAARVSLTRPTRKNAISACLRLERGARREPIDLHPSRQFAKIELKRWLDQKGLRIPAPRLTANDLGDGASREGGPATLIDALQPSLAAGTMPKNAIFRRTKETEPGGPRHEHERIAPEELANFVKDKVSTGRYSSSSEVVREALRLMERTEQQEAEKLALLRQAWKEGIDSGDAGEIDFTALKKEARARLMAER
jgi:antitoxin ParD1/3/4